MHIPVFRALTAAVLSALVALGAAAEEKGIAWLTSLDDAMAQARKEKKLIFTDMYAEWCPPCKMMESTTFEDEGVIKLLSEFVSLKVDADKQPEFLEKYSDGSLPTLAIIDADGKLLDSTVGFLDPAQFQQWIAVARTAGERLAKLEATLKEDPGDALAAIDLASHYVRTHDGARAAAVLAAIPADAVSSLSKADQAQLLFTRAMAAFSAENFDAAVTNMQAFMQEFPDDPRSADMGQYVLHATFLGARAAFRNGDYDKARKAYTELAMNTSIPGVAETARMEIARLDLMGKPAPALDVSEWVGDPVDLAALKGRVVLIDFFQIIDPFNETSAPAIAELRKKYGEKLVVFGIASAFDAFDEQTPDAIKAYLAEKNVSYTVGIDREHNKTFTTYGGMGSPWTVLLDRDGNIVFLDFFEAEPVAARLAALLGE
jgi:thioredoxin 1